MRRRGEEEPVLEAVRKVAHRLRELARDGVASGARRRGVMGFIEDEEGARPDPPRPREGRLHRLVREQAVRDDEARTGPPRVDAEPAGPTQVEEVVPVDYLEGEAELRGELAAPLLDHGRRRCDHDVVDSTSQQQLADDEAGLDRLAEAASSAIRRLTRGRRSALRNGSSW